ncbi:DUF1521 domain-containing protein, partial [Paraburkholderia bannensis]|uniref:DUF1521 domain-containing protein n=1 Tax=Paraburkholderia bannensis TaxID=765414 RepID=UPI002AB7DBE1
MQASFNTADFSFANNQRDDTFPGAQLQSSASASQQYFMGSSQMAFSRNDGLDDNGNSYHSSYGWMSNSMQSGGWNSGIQAPSPSSNSRGLDSMSAWSDSGFRHSSSEFGNASGFGYVENDSSFGDYGCSQYRNQPTNSGCRDGIGQRNAWSDSGVNGNTAQVNLGNYTLDFNKSNSSMNLTNNQTGNKTKVWGDPHIDLNAGTSKQTSGMFNGPLTFTLPDHTHVSV